MAMRHVLLLTNEIATVSAVSSVLSSNGKLVQDDICRNLDDLTIRLSAAPSPAVLVDVDSQPKHTLAALEPLVRRFNDTRFVVLSENLASELLLEAMQVGARHVLLKSTINSDLAGVLERLCPKGSGKRGSVVTVLSAGGGCGATTIAVNLALELQMLDEKRAADPALVMDLDPHYGAAASYLGLDSDYGILDLLNRTGPLDPALIQSTALPFSDRLHAMSSSGHGHLGESSSIDPDRLGEAVDACKGAFRCTVIDAPRIGNAQSAQLARHSDAVLIVIQLNVKDIRVAKKMLDGLTSWGVSTAAVTIVANRYHRRRTTVTLEEARKAMDLGESTELVCLSNDYSAVNEAVNFGKLLFQAAPRSDFRRDLKKLAESLTAKMAAIEAVSK